MFGAESHGQPYKTLGTRVKHVDLLVSMKQIYSFSGTNDLSHRIGVEGVFIGGKLALVGLEVKQFLFCSKPKVTGIIAIAAQDVGALKLRCFSLVVA